MPFVVNIEYPSEFYPEYDKIIQDRLGYSDSSGMGFGVRDKQFEFDSREAAENFIKKACSPFMVNVTISDVEEF